MRYEVGIEQVESHPLAVVRRRVSSHELARVVPEACGLVWNVVRSRKITGAGRQVAIYWDCQINLEVGVEVELPFVGEGDVVGSNTPAGSVVTTTHLGPYSRLHEAHQAILEWAAAQGQALAGPHWEAYGHWQEAWNSDPSKILTDVFYLIKTS